MSGPRSLRAFRAWWAQRPPAAGAAVMATGIVSVGLRVTGQEVLSWITLVLACAVWAGLAADFGVCLVRDRERWWADARQPPSLTAVAATTVLGTLFALLGRPVLAEVLLASAAVLWPVLLVGVLRNCRRGMPGSVFLCCVATQGLAVLCAALAGSGATAWLAHAALVLFWLGLVLYGFALSRFDPREVTRGQGDHWVAGGALAISALAGSKLLAADSARLYLWNDDDRGVLRTVTAALLVLDLAWYAVLLVAEAARPRLRYDSRRWSTVFPLGMTAVAVLSAAASPGAPWLKGPGQVLLWIAVAVWAAVAAGAAADVRGGLRSTAPR